MRSRTRLLPWSAAALALALAGCAGNALIGSGPPPSGPRFEAAYASYKSRLRPGAFAVSADGQHYGATICPEFGGCRTNGAAQARRNCEQLARQPCFIYDIEGRVVWRGDAPAPGTALAAAPGRPTGGPGRFPTIVEGMLTAAIERRPYTPAELKSPAVASIVAQCRARGGASCEAEPLPGGRRTAFTRGRDRTVNAFFMLKGLTAGGTYDIRCRFLDPQGSVVLTVTAPYTVPPAAPGWQPGMKRACTMRLPPDAPVGPWAVELLVDGASASLLRFAVNDGPGLRAT